MSHFPGETTGKESDPEWELLRGVFQQPATDGLTEVPGSLKQGSEAEGRVTELARALWTEVREVLMVVREYQTGHQMT